MSKIVINTDHCKGCMLCIEVCPKKSLKISKDLNKSGYSPVIFVDDGKCTACGFCFQTCPEICIEVHK